MVSAKTRRLLEKIHGKGNKTVAKKPAPTTLSLAQALKKYKSITEHDIIRHKIPILWRRNFGNTTGSLLVADLERLKGALVEEAHEEKVQALKEELGEEGYAKHVQEETAVAEQRANDKADGSYYHSGPEDV